jgi:hypothetical protein
MQEPAQPTERKIPWWVWAFVVLSLLVFIGFFLTFAIGVTHNGADG